jgi:hypothetical protein
VMTPPRGTTGRRWAPSAPAWLRRA